MADLGQVPWKGPPERVIALLDLDPATSRGIVSEWVVWEYNTNWVVNSSQAKYGRDIDREQVLRGKYEKDFEKRVKEC